MSKDEAKKALENYAYDYEYFIEKSNERERFKFEMQNSIERAQYLYECDPDGEKGCSELKEIIEREKKEEEFLADILRRKQLIEDIIKILPQPERTILYLKYIRFYSFGQIAAKMHYSTKRIYQLHAVGLERFTELYNSR